VREQARRAPTFDDADLLLLESLAASITVAIENARRYDDLKASEARLRVQVGALRLDIARRERFGEIVGTSTAMGEVLRLMESAGGSPIAVLIEGETGTGKELVARGIHRASPRADHAFVAVNCAALPEALLESELFGHRKGSFTGATQDHRGLFEAASGGTILLDEVGEMPLAMQAKLLRVCRRTRSYRSATRARAASTSASSRRRTATVRSRPEADVPPGPLLSARRVSDPRAAPPRPPRRRPAPRPPLPARGGRAAGSPARGIDPAAMEALVQFAWPGNVRELQNEMERAATLARDGDRIGIAHLSNKLQRPVRERGDALPTDDRPLREARAEFEARHIAGVLERHDGNVTHAAMVLGLSRAMLQRKMKDLGLR
jgi:Nif-specific regulatory protein